MSDESRIRIGIVIVAVVAFIALRFSLISAETNIRQGVTVLQNEIWQTEQQEDTKLITSADKVKDEVKDTVVNGNYVENFTIITNEAEKNSYVLPITLAIVLGFIVLMYDKRRDAKKEDMEKTERILKTPLKTFADEELSELKSKYDKES